jgi:hypothetical protein
MKAIVYTRDDLPGVVTLAEAPKLTPQDRRRSRK